MTGIAPPGAYRAVTILLVEDHAVMRSSIVTLLAQSFPGCTVHTADNAEAALAMCELALPDVVVMDIGLPGMNGIDATRTIKQDHPNVHVVIFTHSDLQIFRDSARAAGASGFVGKQQAHMQLPGIIRELLPLRND